MTTRGLTVVLLALSFGIAHAQVNRASVSGTVLDPAGAAIPGVKALIQSEETGLRRETNSDERGVYLLTAIPVGSYKLSFSKDGFRTKEYEGVELQVGQARTIDVSLLLGQVTTSIEVTDEAAPLQTRSAELGLVVDKGQISSLPLNGRNWTSLLALAPGATNTGEGSQNTVRFNGRSRDDNNFTLDGVDATGVKDPRQEANLRLNISMDAISEFQVGTGLYSAESGNGAGAQMNLVSKSGTNQWHGGAFEYFRNDKLDARQPIASTKPPFRLNQFGGNIGGPIVKNKTFFFTNYEGLEQRLATPLVTGSKGVPSAAYRAQVIAQSPILKPIMDAFPAGQSRTSNADIDNYAITASQPWTEKSGLMKVDHQFTNNTSMYVRYNLDDGRITEYRNVLLETRISNFRTQNGVIALQHIFTPGLISETRMGVNRSALHRDTNGTFSEAVLISGLVDLQPDLKEVEIGTSYGLGENLTWNKGRHTFKFGGEVRKIDLILSNSGAITTTFASRALFMQNKADSVAFASALPGIKGTRPYFFLFAQDEVKVTRTLTMNIGMRYEYYKVAKTSDGRGRVLDFQRCGGFCAPGTPWYFADKNNWAPRFGLAWSPKGLGGHTVFRTGYGIFYGPGQIDDVNSAIDSIPENYALSAKDVPALAFPAVQFVGQAKSTGISARALQRDRRDGYSQEWTFSIQQQLPMNFALQTTYVGSNGHHLFGRSFINTVDPATGVRPYPTFSNIDIKTNDNNSSFNAFQLSLLRPMRSGFQWQMQYMWSHNISDNAGAGDGANIMISNCRSCDRGAADWDVRHTFTANSIYELPYGKGRRFTASNGFVDAILGGWMLSGFYTARTGLPFSVTVNRSSTDLPDAVATTPGKAAPAQRPNIVPGVPVYLSNPGPQGWLNPAAFAVPAKGTWGNLARNSLRGPGLWQMDLGVSKQAQLRENLRLEFRAEMFNLFNRAQYANPNANISSPGNFGLITSVVNTSPTGSGTPRQIQLMLRLKF